MVNLFDNVSGFRQAKSYAALLEGYRRALEKYEKKAEALNVSKEDQMAAIQVALDLTYLKEELDVMKPCQEQMAKNMEALNEMLKELAPAQELLTEKVEEIHAVRKKGRGMRLALILSLLLNVITGGGLLVTVLYIMGIISF